MNLSKTMISQGPDYCLTIYLDHRNLRVRVDDYLGNIDQLLEESERIAKLHKVEKLIIKARETHFIKLLERGYRCEAVVDHYFLGSDCLFFSKFYSAKRSANEHWSKEEVILEDVSLLQRQSPPFKIPGEFQLEKMEGKDAEKLAKLYKQVFELYPTPLNDPEYIKQTIKEGTVYYGFRYNGEIISAASAEINSFYKNAELTDCATLKEFRKYGLMKVLLLELEKELKLNGIFCTYSIARALSFGMNAALHQLGYSYRGRLVNNCFIFDKLEDMNVWVRDLSKDAGFSAVR